MPRKYFDRGKALRAKANAGPTGAKQGVWRTLGVLELFGLWVTQGTICLQLLVIFHIMGVLAQSTLDLVCDMHTGLCGVHSFCVNAFCSTRGKLASLAFKS